jgi:hypothetical protein
MLRLEKNNGKFIYEAFTTIIKTFVSQVADSLKITRKNDLSDSQDEVVNEEADVNKADENMIKIFMTVSDATGESSDSGELILIFCIALSAILHIVLTFLSGNLYDQTMTLIHTAGPHINSFLGALAYQIGSSFGMLQFIGATNNSTVFEIGLDIICQRTQSLFESSNEYYRLTRFGNKNKSINPFSAFSELEKIDQIYSCSENKIIARPISVQDGF